MSAYLVGGLVLGGIYAIATVGLVLTYRSSRVFNFAHGAIAYFLAITFHWLAVDQGWPRLTAGLFTILVAGPVLGVILWAVLFRRLAHAPASVRLVSTVGLWVALPPIARVVYGHREIFDRLGMGPSPARTWKITGVVVDSNQIAVLVSALVVAALLAVLLRTTAWGLSVRATVDNPMMAGIAGIDTERVTAGAWMLGVALAGLAGVLLAPLRGYQDFQFTLLVIAAFAAVVIARMSSLVLAFGGSILIGMLQSLSQSKQAEDLLTHILPKDSIILKGLVPSIPFVLMLVFLLLYRGLAREQFLVDERAGDAVPLDPVVGDRSLFRRLAPLAVLLAVVVALPYLVSGLWQAVVAKGLALSIAFLSYTVVTGEGGMISLCQVTFAGIAGALTARFATGAGMATLPAVLLAALIVVPFGLLVALPSLRLGDLYLALATLAFAELVENMYFQLQSVNQFDSGVAVPRPRIGPIGFSGDRAFYYLLVVLFAVVALLVVNVRRSTTGLTLAAVRSSEPAAATLGISIIRAKLVAFGLSAFIAGLGGGLYVTYAQRSLPYVSFNALIGIVWLAVVVTWGIRSVPGALLAGLSFAVIPHFFSEHFSGGWLELPTMLFGLGAIGLARRPRGIVHDVTHRRRQRAAARATAAKVAT
ncbi:MAG: ABC-type branched-chain amino acid transport system, permease component [Acidimicrobiales bacterium]|jgi:branched-chain amino acid transport system permease protein|nr:ABC-type branched-chain amino acid transport system, permease component [Acidimicrobiales bacterium]